MHRGLIHSFILFYCKQRHREDFLQIQVEANEQTGTPRTQVFLLLIGELLHCIIHGMHQLLKLCLFALFLNISFRQEAFLAVRLQAAHTAVSWST